MNTNDLAYSNLNLRYNPFGEIDRETRGKIAVANVDHLLKFLNDKHSAVQIIGDQGSGKTSLMLSLHLCFDHAPYIFVRQGTNPTVPADDIVFIDEMQRFGFFKRYCIFKRTNRLVFATHKDFNRELKRFGFSVKTVNPSESINVNSLYSIFTARIDWAKRSSGPVPELSHSLIKRLLCRYKSNVRAMEHELYIKFQNLKEMTDGSL